MKIGGIIFLLLLLAGVLSAIYFLYSRIKEWHTHKKISVLQVILMIIAVILLLLLIRIIFALSTNSPDMMLFA